MSKEHLLRQVGIGLQLSPLDYAFQDFLLSRKAMRCTPATLSHYRFTAGKWVEWLEGQGVTDPKDVTSSHVREWLALDADRLSDRTIHARTRGVRTLLRYLYAEGFMPQLMKSPMPLEERRLLCREAEEVHQVLGYCNVKAKAIVMVLADSGVRPASSAT